MSCLTIGGAVQATTSETADGLGLRGGGRVRAVIEASDVMVGKN